MISKLIKTIGSVLAVLVFGGLLTGLSIVFPTIAAMFIFVIGCFVIGRELAS